MELIYNSTPRSNAIAIDVKHHAEKVPFTGQATERSLGQPEGREDRMYDIFSHINGYYRSLSGARQNAIFRKMLDIRTVLDETFSALELITKLKPLVAQLVEMHPFGEIRMHLIVSGEVSVPATVKESFDTGLQQPGSREQTYIRQEYLDLITTATVLRVVYPIFIEFVSRTIRVVGTDAKEMYAFSILADSYLMEHPALARLNRYIAGCLERRVASSDLALIINGLGSENLPYFVLAFVVVKKICCGDIRGIGDSGSMIHVIWQTVNGLLTADRGAGGANRIALKRNPGEGRDDSDAAGSRLEGSKIYTSLSLSQIGIMAHAAHNALTLARHVCPEIDEGLLQELLVANRNARLRSEITDAQITLAQWVLGKAVSPAAFPHMDSGKMINALSAAQAILWHYGFEHLAGILTATPVRGHNDAVMLTGTVGRVRLSQDIMLELSECYADTLPVSCDSDEARVKHMRNSEVMRAVANLSSALQANDWHTSLPAHYNARVTGNPLDRRLVPMSEIITMITQVVIKIVCQ